MSDVQINPLFAGLGMARLIRETAGRFMRTGIALRICNLVDADEPSLKEDDVCGVQARRLPRLAQRVGVPSKRRPSLPLPF